MVAAGIGCIAAGDGGGSPTARHAARGATARRSGSPPHRLLARELSAWGGSGGFWPVIRPAAGQRRRDDRTLAARSPRRGGSVTRSDPTSAGSPPFSSSGHLAKAGTQDSGPCRRGRRHEEGSKMTTYAQHPPHAAYLPPVRSHARAPALSAAPATAPHRGRAQPSAARTLPDRRCSPRSGSHRPASNCHNSRSPPPVTAVGRRLMHLVGDARRIACLGQ
jgi:hypothetical protein